MFCKGVLGTGRGSSNMIACFKRDRRKRDRQDEVIPLRSELLEESIPAAAQQAQAR